MFEEIAARIESNRDVRQDSRLDAMVRCAERLGPADRLLVRLLRAGCDDPRSCSSTGPACRFGPQFTGADSAGGFGSASVRKRWPPKETGRQENREKRISHEPTS